MVKQQHQNLHTYIQLFSEQPLMRPGGAPRDA
jgi:hypothetical protein